MFLEMIPHESIGVELRQVGPPKKPPEPAGPRTDKIKYLARQMRGIPIHNQEDRSPRVVRKPHEKFDELVRVHAPVHRHEAHIPARTAHRDDFHAIALPGRLDNGCLYDPHTNGGLLVTVAPEAVDDVMMRLREHGYRDAAVIGEILPDDGDRQGRVLFR